MKLKLALDEKQLDTRLRDRLTAEGKLSKSQVDTYLSSLPEEPESSYERVTDEESTEETTTTTEQ